MTSQNLDRTNLQTAVVSGATGAIGSAICARLLRSGWHVEMVGRDANRLEKARNVIATDRLELERLSVCVVDINDDMSVRDGIRAIAERRQHIALLVNAAGDGPVAPLLETTEAMWQSTLQGKLMGTVRLARAAAAQMQKQGIGHIIIVNGTFSKEPHPLFPINSTVNCALAGFAKSISHDLGPRGVRVNVVNPGITSSPLWNETANQLAKRFGIDAEQVSEQLLEKNPLRRFATPENVADAVHLLSCPDSAYINGATLDVDGGNLAAL